MLVFAARAAYKYVDGAEGFGPKGLFSFSRCFVGANINRSCGGIRFPLEVIAAPAWEAAGFAPKPWISSFQDMCASINLEFVLEIAAALV